MANNETKIIISAATAQAEGALRSLSSTVDTTIRKFFDMSGVAGTLAGALSITAFAGFIKGAINAADNLKDLSQKTGTSVEMLAGMQLAADQSGTSMEAIAKAAQKLSVNMADKPDLFKKFGVTATDTTGALVQLADIFAAMPDGVEKAALAQQLFGKSGAEMIPLLNQGSEALRRMAEEGASLNPITAEMAAQADQFNDSMAALKMQAGGLGITLANDMLPALNDIIKAMSEAAKEGGLLKAAWVGLGGIGAALFTDEFDAPLKKAQIQLKEFEGKLEQATRKDHQGAGWLHDFLYGNTKDIEQKIASIKALIAELEAAQNQPNPKPGGTKPGSNTTGEEILCELSGGKWVNGKCVKKSAAPKTDPNASAVGSLQDEQFRKQMELMGVAAAQVKVYELAKKGATKAQIIAAQSAADETLAIEAQIKMQKDGGKALEESNRSLAAAAKDAQAIIYDLDPMAKLQAEWEKLNALRDQGLLTDEQAGKAYQKTFSDINKSGNETFKSLEAAARGWGDQFTNTLADMVMTGKGSFKGLADSIIRDMMRMQIQQNVTKPLMDWGSGVMKDVFGSVFGGSGGSMAAPGSANDVLASMGVPNAQGGVYAGTGISAYSGSVVSRPTVFPFARGIGLMGEAGPEAIMPLTRINGKLGVQSAGGGAPNVTVNVVNQSGNKVNARQQGSPQFDGRGWVLGVVLEAADSDPGFRNAFGIGAR